MPALIRDRTFAVWALLVAVTLLSVAIGGVGAAARLFSPGTVTVAVLAIAVAKVWVVMFNFMDVRGAPVMLRALCTAWLTIVLGGLLAVYAGVLP